MQSINWEPVSLALIPLAFTALAIWAASRQRARKQRENESQSKG